MNKKLSFLRKDLVPPYRNDDLLSVEEFLNFCTIRGIHLTITELEQMDKLDLILPATGSYQSEPKQIRYSPYQAFCVKAVKDKTNMCLNLNLFDYSQDDWYLLGKRYSELVKHLIPEMQIEILQYNKEFTVLYKLLDIFEGITLKAETSYRESIRDGYSKRENIVDFNATIKGSSECVIPAINKLLKEYSLTIDDISLLQHKYISSMFLTDPTKEFHSFLENVPYEKLEKATGDLRLALDSYAIADNFGLCLEILGNKSVSPEYVFSGISKQKICKYCNKPYLITKKEKNTCGASECVKKWKNEWKRDRLKEEKSKKHS